MFLYNISLHNLKITFYFILIKYFLVLFIYFLYTYYINIKFNMYYYISFYIEILQRSETSKIQIYIFTKLL